jgi:hypothetical protein
MTRRHLAIGLVAIAACLLVLRLVMPRPAGVADPTPKGSGPPAPPLDKSAPARHPALAAMEPAVVAALEERGLSLGARLGAKSSRTNDLAGDSPAYRDVRAILRGDLSELSSRANVGEGIERGNHPFRPTWLDMARTRFELTGVIARVDRRTGEAARGCGELRLVYRLVADPENRPPTRLPMTLNLLFPQAASAGPAECAALVKRLRTLPAAGEPRVAAIVDLFRDARFDQIEVNLQNVHGPSLRVDMDDHAEYILRAFDVDARGARPRGLFNTPRRDLDATGREKLLAYVRAAFEAIDDGTWVVPSDLLAERVVSVTPRGLERPNNRTWEALLDRASLDALPYARAKLVKSPTALLRRLDEGTCAGCHQTRGVAGFHLLGEERSATPFNSLAVGGSQHFNEELAWREEVLGALADGRPLPPHPFTARPLGAGGYGSACGLGDPGFAAWICNEGLECLSLGDGPLGLCAPKQRADGDACQSARITPREGADGDRVALGPLETCGGDGGLCSPNGYGFPGGICSTGCETLGDVQGDTICADIPSSGYESDCFFVPVPIEKCIETHKARRRVRACDVDHPCRPDYACAAIPGATQGACVPPYFVFEARVDGPMLDRP